MNIRQLLVDLGDLPYYRKLERELAGMENVLDLGCGSNSPLAKVKKTFHSVGVDIFEPAIKKSRKLKIHDEYKISSVLEADKKLKASSFDAVIALDLIEHLNKADGVKLIKMMSKLAKKKVIIFTPNGYYNQDPYEDNPYQVHRSGWGVDPRNQSALKHSPKPDPFFCGKTTFKMF